MLRRIGNIGLMNSSAKIALYRKLPLAVAKYSSGSSLFKYVNWLKRGYIFNDDSWKLFLNKKIVLLKGAMVKRRFLMIPFPFQMLHSYSISDICGHCSFLFLACSYLESDFLALRVFAMSGLSLSIIFQYYRERPLWLPIKWNILFLLINASMILLILKEAHDAEHLPLEQKEIYEKVFRNHGMKAIDFLHLIELAERRQVKRGEKLVSLGSKHHHLHFIKVGKCSVKRKNEILPKIHENQFVGVLSFLTWEDRKLAQDRFKQAKVDQYQMWNSDGDISFPRLMSIRNDSDITTIANANSNSGGLSTDISSSSSLPSAALATTHSSPQSDSSISAAIAKITSSPSTDNNNIIAPLSVEEENRLINEGETQSGLADVACDVDCIVYSWEFKSLRELLVTSPGLNLVFEKCISSDLNKKMSQNWSTVSAEYEATYQKAKQLERYSHFLNLVINRKRETHLAAIRDSSPYINTNMINSNGNNNLNSSQAVDENEEEEEVTENDRALINLLRREYNISASEHESILQSLGWTNEQYLVGTKSKTNSVSLEVLTNYIKLVQNTIKDKEMIHHANKNKLQYYRDRYNISLDNHIKALHLAGWKYNEFERGQKY